MLGKHLSSTAPSQHVGPPSHPHARCPTCSVWLSLPWELLTISLQATVHTVSACWAHPMCLSGVSCGVQCSHGVLQCSAPCLLPRLWQQRWGEFLAGLKQGSGVGCGLGIPFSLFSSYFCQSVKAGLPAARCCELLGMWQTALPCSWVMGSLEGSPTLEVGPEGLQA